MDCHTQRRISADIAIVGGDLERVPWLIAHARRVTRVMHQKLAWAFGYNALAIAAAAAGLLTPIIAAFAMLISSAAVLANARRLADTGPRESARIIAAPEDAQRDAFA